LPGRIARLKTSFRSIKENAMEIPKYKTALIVGAGEGLSASLARLFAREGIRLALAARGIEKLGALCSETGAKAFSCNATEADDVERLFGLVEREIAVPDLVVYNASGRARGAFVDLVADDVAQAISVSAFGGFLVAQQAAKRMLPNRHGAILFTGASASVKGYPQSAPFAMGKFALRGLAQSMARELSPQGIHVAHFVIDGGIRSTARAEPADRPDSMLDPDAIAASYWSVLQQPRSAWTWELELRPWVEKF
jgi:NAD(P)-dependent dehydrogenase (short-subunit alcohol dehydrogenase family)